MKDKCIMCNKETLFDVTDHIDMRYGYIEGAGQLCLDCYCDKTSMTSKITIPKELILNVSNDQELGGIVRNLFYKHLNH